MADSLVSRFGCYTIIWDTTAIEQRRRLSSPTASARRSLVTTTIG